MMKNRTRAFATRTLLAGLIPILAGTATAAAAQDDPDEGERPRIGVEDLLPGAQPDPQQEMIELFHAVERRLKDMGGHLLAAGAGDASRLKDLEQAGIEDLLRRGRPQSPQPTGSIADLLSVSKAEGDQVIEDIARILELALQNGGT